MLTSRREFLRKSSAYSLGFLALRQCVQSAAAGQDATTLGYGPLVPDPKGLLDLPAGFSYKVISRAGDMMDDGLFVPGKADGMATFEGADGLALIVRNHELLPFEEPSPFGTNGSLLTSVNAAKIYDIGRGRSPHRGGTTTVVFDTKRQEVVRQFMSLAGTCRNCAGGPTPWKSWISCEETVIVQGRDKDGDFMSDKDHGYCFDVPATDVAALADPIPLVDMGRFNHEAVAVDPRTGIVYETEDREDGLFFRFLPNKPGELKAGGKLQALCVVGFEPNDTRNWGPHESIAVGSKLRVTWIDMDHVEAPDDDLRQRGFAAGAARFARGEGIWHSDGQFFIACTSGGQKQKGQVWRYVACRAGRRGRRRRLRHARVIRRVAGLEARRELRQHHDVAVGRPRDVRGPGSGSGAADRRDAARRAVHAGRTSCQERVRGRLLYAGRHDAAGEHPAPRADDRGDGTVAAPRLKARSHMSFRGPPRNPAGPLGGPRGDRRQRYPHHAAVRV